MVYSAPAKVLRVFLMGNFLPRTSPLEFWHRREGMPDRLHRSKGTMMTYDNMVEYCGEACDFEEGNESSGLNFEQFEVVAIERYTRRNIFIDRTKGTAEVTAALVDNKDGIRPGSKIIKVTLPNNEKDVGKVVLLGEYKNELAVFYVAK